MTTSTNTNSNATGNTASSAKGRTGSAPTHIAYHIREIGGGDSKKSFWTRIGSAWPHADGNGFNIQIDVVPLDGRITLRVADDKKD